MKNYTTIIIGGGIAAIQLAKHLNPQSRVLLITKSSIHNSNSYRAQGGIAAALGEDDQTAFHFKDTVEAGCQFNNEKTVEQLTSDGPNIIKQLVTDGLQFDRNNNGGLSLGMEGAHSRNRIVHCGGDATGKHLVDHLLKVMPTNIDIIENAFAYELMIHPETNACIGVKVKNADGENRSYYGSRTVLATGGVGGLYSFTSNDATVTGDGIALAYNAGAELIDMEFIQFHPTLLYINGKTYGLVSEAVRGEGGRIVNQNGHPLMKDKHPMGDLAPRHIVAKEIYEQRQKGQEVFLDISMIENFNVKFPTITALCETNGVLIAEGKIPIAPGCHFLMGGIHVNEVGQTSIDELYAIGEVAATGVHGANRLASNSLLEALHYGKRVAQNLNTSQVPDIQPFIYIEKKATVPSLNLPTKEVLQENMMAYAGIMRTKEGLMQLEEWLRTYDAQIPSIDNCSIEDAQVLLMIRAAKLITHAALVREESRGAHFREDFPSERKEWKEIHIKHSNITTYVGSEVNEQTKIKIHA